VAWDNGGPGVEALECRRRPGAVGGAKHGEEGIGACNTVGKMRTGVGKEKCGSEWKSGSERGSGGLEAERMPHLNGEGAWGAIGREEANGRRQKEKGPRGPSFRQRRLNGPQTVAVVQ